MSATIQNGIGITRSRMKARMDPYVDGEPQGLGRDMAYENPLLAQISTITLSATADVSDEIVAAQVWSIVLTDPEGVEYETLYTVTAADNTAGTDGAGLAYMAGVLAAAIEANPEKANIVSAISSGAVITLTWLHANQGTWTVAATCTPAAAEAVLTDVVATSQTAGGSTLPMARFVQVGTPQAGSKLPRATLLQSDTSTIAGVAMRDLTQVRPFDTSATAVNAYPVGSLVSVREVGEVSMENVSDAAAAANGKVWAVISTTGGDALGQARASREGVAQVTTATPTAANTTVYGLQVHFPAFEDYPAVTFTFGDVISDGSGDATEICDAFRTLMAANAAFTARVVASGTTTLVLTSQIPGMAFLVTDQAEAGDWASITTGTANAVYTRLVPGARWIRPVAAGEIGVLYVQQ